MPLARRDAERAIPQSPCDEATRPHPAPEVARTRSSGRPVGGHYRFELTRTGAGWKISSLTLQTFLQTGSRALLQESSG
jgi:hypothetical protein